MTDAKRTDAVAARIKSGESFEEELYAAVRQAYPINGVPGNVCDALEGAVAHIRAEKILLKRLMDTIQGKSENHSEGSEYSAKDIKTRSAHRPAS
jgi:hypothetical protein